MPGKDFTSPLSAMQMPMITIDPGEVTVQVLHSFLLSAVTPRPIALASTVDAEGNVNLSPFSFFNCFGSNPPLLIFSPARRVRDNTTKHTYENVLEVAEVVIHIVNYEMVHQTSLASSEYEKGVNEFVKAGFTPQASVMVAPPRIKEAPVAMECRVTQVISTGDKGGAANLILCEMLLMHIRKDVIGEDGRIDPVKLDVVSRLGGDWYARIGKESLFKVPKPLDKPGIGIDQLPDFIRTSDILTGNDLGRLANIDAVPSFDAESSVLREASADVLNDEGRRTGYARQLIKENRMKDAWQLLLYKTKNPD
jgi:flavin reductase (DIM6/NTAB) family NADH-FMN oxidoreductase RutF